LRYPRKAAGASQAALFVLQVNAMLLLAFIGEFDGERGIFLIAFALDDI
jgi:hypothetical protein